MSQDEPLGKNLLVATTASVFLFVFDLLTLAPFLIYLRILTLLVWFFFFIFFH